MRWKSRVIISEDVAGEIIETLSNEQGRKDSFLVWSTGDRDKLAVWLAQEVFGFEENVLFDFTWGPRYHG